MRPSISAEFRVRGEVFNPLEFSKEILLSESKMWFKGDIIMKGSILKRKDNAWIICTPEINSFSVESQIRKVLLKVRPYSKWIISKVQAQKLNVEISVVVYLKSDQTPSIYLVPNIIKEISKYNALVDIDLIHLGA
jgi:hypothetical protein